MSIAQEMLSYSQGQTSYKVRVKSFKHKMNTWKKGRFISLKRFKVDGISLQMTIYPNGMEEEYYVSIYINNLSEFDITMVLSLSMGDEKVDDPNFPVEKFDSWGFPNFYVHSDRNMRKHKDEDFEITLTVKKLYKEVLGENVDSNIVTQSLDRMERKFSSSNDEMKKRLANLENSMKSLTVRDNTSNGGPEIPYPECPICLEDITQNSRIMQCSAGHLICGGCHDKLVGNFCPSCKKPIIGRCHGMETYLRSLFPEKKKPATNNNDRVYQCYGATIRYL